MLLTVQDIEGVCKESKKHLAVNDFRTTNVAIGRN